MHAHAPQKTRHRSESESQRERAEKEIASGRDTQNTHSYANTTTNPRPPLQTQAIPEGTEKEGPRTRPAVFLLIYKRSRRSRGRWAAPRYIDRYPFVGQRKKKWEENNRRGAVKRGRATSRDRLGIRSLDRLLDARRVSIHHNENHHERFLTSIFFLSSFSLDLN